MRKSFSEGTTKKDVSVHKKSQKEINMQKTLKESNDKKIQNIINNSISLVSLSKHIESFKPHINFFIAIKELNSYLETIKQHKQTGDPTCKPTTLRAFEKASKFTNSACKEYKELDAIVRLDPNSGHNLQRIVSDFRSFFSFPESQSSHAAPQQDHTQVIYTDGSQVEKERGMIDDNSSEIIDNNKKRKSTDFPSEKGNMIDQNKRINLEYSSSEESGELTDQEGYD